MPHVAKEKDNTLQGMFIRLNSSEDALQFALDM